MKKYSEAFVGFDTAKKKHAVAIADGGRKGEVRYLGEIDTSPATVEKVIGKLAERYAKLHVCYEAGPTGYGLYRQIKALEHDCTVVPPSLIPKKPGERVKTNHRDAVMLARLLRAGELTSVWVPDVVHEAVRDLARAREAAAADLRKKRQQLPPRGRAVPPSQSNGLEDSVTEKAATEPFQAAAERGWTSAGCICVITLRGASRSARTLPR
jgi:transposase